MLCASLGLFKEISASSATNDTKTNILETIERLKNLLKNQLKDLDELGEKKKTGNYDKVLEDIDQEIEWRVDMIRETQVHLQRTQSDIDKLTKNSFLNTASWGQLITARFII